MSKEQLRRSEQMVRAAGRMPDHVKLTYCEAGRSNQAMNGIAGTIFGVDDQPEFRLAIWQWPNRNVVVHFVNEQGETTRSIDRAELQSLSENGFQIVGRNINGELSYLIMIEQNQDGPLLTLTRHQRQVGSETILARCVQ